MALQLSDLTDDELQFMATELSKSFGLKLPEGFGQAPKPTLGEAVSTITQPQNLLPLTGAVQSFATGSQPGEGPLKKFGRQASRAAVGPAAALDVLSTPFKAIRPAVGPVFGLDKGTTFPERLEKGFEDPLNFTLATAAAGKAAQTSVPELEKAILSGDQQAIDKARGEAKGKAFIAGAVTDIAEGLGMGAIFKGLGGASKLKQVSDALPDEEIATLLQTSVAKPKLTKLAKTATPKAEKQAIIGRAKAAEQAQDAVRLEQTLAKTKEQAIGRGRRSDIPFTPANKNVGKAAKATLRKAKKERLAQQEKHPALQGLKKTPIEEGISTPKKTGIDDIIPPKGRVAEPVAGTKVTDKVEKAVIPVIKETKPVAKKLSKKQKMKQDPRVKELREVRKKKLVEERQAKLAKRKELTPTQKKRQRLAALKQKGEERKFTKELKARDAEIERLKTSKASKNKIAQKELERDLHIVDFMSKRHGGGIKFGSKTGAVGDVGPIRQKQVQTSLQRTIAKHYPQWIKESEKTGKSLSKVISEKTNFNSASVKRIEEEVRSLVAVAKKTGKVGNIQLSKFSKEVQDAIKKAPEELPEVTSKRTIKRQERLASVGRKEVNELAEEIVARPDADLAALADNRIVMVKKLVEAQRKSGKDFAPQIAEAVRAYQKLRSAAGRILEASKRPPDVDEVIFVLKDALKKKKLTDAEAAGIEEALSILDVLPKVPRRDPSFLDQLLELTSANMLSSTDTMMRNVLGNTQLSGLKLANKATQEVLSVGVKGIEKALGAVAGRRVSLPVKGRAVAGETFIETASMLKNVPRGAKNALRFILNESDGDVLVALQHQYKDVLSTPLAKIHPNPKVARAIRVKMLRELREDVGRIIEKQGVSKVEDFTTQNKAIPEISDPFSKLLPKWAHRFVKPENLKKHLPLKIDVRNKSGDITKSITFGGSTIRLPFRTLKAGDEMFGLLAEESTRNALKWRKIIQSGQKIPLNAKFRKAFKKIKLTDAELDDALQDRLYYTLLKDFDTKEAKSFFKWMNNTNLGKSTKFVFRFIRTLTNLSKIAWHHSPLGISTVIKDSAKLGGLDLKSTSRVINGTIAGQLLYSYIKSNKNVEIRGAADTHNQRKQWDKEDFPENSIRVKQKDGTRDVFQFSNNAPATFFLSGVAVRDAHDERKALGMPATQNANKALMSAGRAFLSESYLDTPQQLIGLLDDMNSGKPLINRDDPNESILYDSALGKWMGRFISSQTVPNIVRKTTKTGIKGIIPADPVKRKPRNLGEEFKSAIPFLSKSVPPDLFWDGTPITRKGEKFFNPVKARKDKGSKLDKELSKIKLFPSPPQRTNRGIPLSLTERRNMITKYGPKLRQAMERVVNHPKWDELDQTNQKKVLQKLIRAANSVGYLEATRTAIKRLRQTDEGKSAIEFFRFGGLTHK